MSASPVYREIGIHSVSEATACRSLALSCIFLPATRTFPSRKYTVMLAPAGNAFTQKPDNAVEYQGQVPVYVCM